MPQLAGRWAAAGLLKSDEATAFVTAAVQAAKKSLVRRRSRLPHPSRILLASELHSVHPFICTNAVIPMEHAQTHTSRRRCLGNSAGGAA